MKINNQTKTAFLFTGQGSQYVNMAKELYETQPVFRSSLQQCDNLLHPLMDKPLLSVLYPEDGRNVLDETAYTQPALFAVEYALAQVWRSWGVAPDFCLGHSVGEYVAACVAGVFGLEDGLRLIAKRGSLMQGLPQEGTMAVIFAPKSKVADFVMPYRETVAISAINGPANVVLSGRADHVDAIAMAFKERGVQSRVLKVSHAFHSPQMIPMIEEFKQVAHGIAWLKPQIPVVSNLTGRIAGDAIATPQYWCDHVLSTVQFEEGVKTLYNEGCRVFIEIGPKATLIEMAKQCVSDSECLWLASLRQGQSEWKQISESLAALYVHGVNVDWQGFDRGYARQVVELPTYPFERQRYWTDVSVSRTVRQEQGHPLIGQRIVSALKAVQFESQLSLERLTFLKDHRLFDKPVFPAAAYVEMVLAAGAAVFKTTLLTIEDIALKKSLILSDNQEKTLQTVLLQENTSQYNFELYSLDENHEDWALHAAGKILENKSIGRSSDYPLLSELKTRISEAVSAATYYEQCKGRNIDYGPGFQAIQELWQAEAEALGRIVQSDTTAGYVFHPVLLDACFQVLGAAFPKDCADGAYMPVQIKGIRLYGRPNAQELWSYARTLKVKRDGQDIEAEIYLYNPDGQLAAVIEGFLLKQINREALFAASKERVENWFYEVVWQPKIRKGEQQPHPLFMPGAEELSRRLSAEAANLLANPQIQHYSQGLFQLEEVSVDYILRAFNELGLTLKQNQRIAMPALAESLSVHPRYRLLLERFLSILAEEGILKSVNSEWVVVLEPQAQDPAEKIDALKKEYTLAHAELALLERCGTRLADVLRGQEDPLELLFPSGDLTTATRLYQDSPGAKLMNTLLREAVDLALKRLPAGRPLRILEIGAGTGGTTASILPYLPECSYTFTDLSALFTNQAKKRFKTFSFVDYKLLDIEKHPKGQGFAHESHDLVIAANVLHATKDLAQSLQHVEWLFAPGGVLLLWEGIAPQRWLDLIFGLTEGWWRFSDNSVRNYPLVSLSTWKHLLEHNGFNNVALMSDSKPQAEQSRFENVVSGSKINKNLLSWQSVIAAQKSACAEPSEPVGRWLIFCDEFGLPGKKVSERIEAARGGKCFLVYPGKAFEQSGDRQFRVNPLNPDDFLRLVHETAKEKGLTGVVYLWGLDSQTGDSLTTEALTQTWQKLCGSALHLVQALVKVKHELPSLWIVTRGTQAAGVNPEVTSVGQSVLWGFGKVVSLEHPGLRCVRVDLDPTEPVHPDREAECLVDEILYGQMQDSAELEDQIAWRSQIRHVARLTRYDALAVEKKLLRPDTESFCLETAERGKPDSLKLRPKSRTALEPGEIEIKVFTSGLNFKDLLNSLGLYPGDPGPLGNECAGEVAALGPGVTGFKVGDKVVAIAQGSFSPYVTTKALLTAHLPEGLSYEEAVTLPVAYLTAYFSLYHLAKIKQGQRVLIHAAAGGVGQAAIRLAQAVGAEIFATASPAKHTLLRSMGVTHVMNSRNLAFTDEVMRLTQGEGVDVALNCLSGDFIDKSLSLVRPGGRFVEIGKIAILTHEEAARAFPNVSYFTVDLAKTCKEEPQIIGPMLRHIMQMVSDGQLKPLPYKAFDIEDSISAFRFMEHARHTGKIVIQVHKTPAFTIDSQGTYLITGGTGGLGLLTAKWLAASGAKHIVLVSRSGVRPDGAQEVEALKRSGVNVVVAKADVSRLAEVKEVIDNIDKSMPVLKGVIHGAGLLDDSTLVNLSIERFQTVMLPKVEGAWNLHTLTKDKRLDFFVLYSSAASLFGSPGQANHASANAFLDALSFYRHSQGLKSLSINWGAWAKTGSAAGKGQVTARGINMIEPEDGLKALELALAQSTPEIGIVPVNWQVLMEHMAGSRFFEDFAVSSRQTIQVKQSDFLSQLKQSPPDNQKALLMEHVRQQIARIMGLEDYQSIDLHKGLFDLGLDSLSSVELANALQSSLNCTLPSTVAFDYPTVAALVDYLAEKLLALKTAANMPDVQKAEKTKDETGLDDLSDEELDAMLEKKLARFGN